MSTWKEIVKIIFDIEDYDRKGEKLIYKSINIYHKGGKLNEFRARRLYNKIRHKYCCNIWPGITLGEGTYIAHAHNVTIGKTAIIGDNCRIYPGSTIIAAIKGDEKRCEAKLRRHAKIGNDCIIGAGSMIIGDVEIGDNVTIAAGAIVCKNIPSHTVVKKVNEIRFKTSEEIPNKYKVGGV